MSGRLFAIALSIWTVCAVMVGCSSETFPVVPTPVANSVSVLQGTRYEGVMTVGSGATTGFNMTLIARGIAGGGFPAESRDTQSVSGNFETGNGLTGTVEGTLSGGLDNGLFSGSLTTTSGSRIEERLYSGPVTVTSVAWAPGACVQTCTPDGLSGAIQGSTPTSQSCSYSLTPTTASFPSDGGNGSTLVTTLTTCAWSAEAVVPWISISGPATGTGTGTVTFTVQSSPGPERSGGLRIAGQMFGVTQRSAPPPPGKVANILPVNGAIGVTVIPTLSWMPATDATSYDVYLGITLSPSPIATTSGTSYIPPALNANTSYQWRIDARNGAATTSGNVWQFTTGAATPQLTPQLSVDPTTGTRVTSFNFVATDLTSNGTVVLHIRDFQQNVIADLSLVASASGTVGRPGDSARPSVLGRLGVNRAWIEDLSRTTNNLSGQVPFTVTSRCDVNSDYFINNGDVDLVLQAALMGSTDPRFDLNRDGQVNISDVQIVGNATTNPDSCPL